jgi:CBS domain-containing protein
MTTGGASVLSRTSVRCRTDAPRRQRSDHERMTLTATTPLLGTIRIKDAMTNGLISCPPETPLSHVAELMAREAIHAIYVFDYGDEDDETVELWGLVSDLDLVAAARGGIDGLTARDASVTPLVTARTDDTLDRAAQLLAENGVSHLAVLDTYSERPVGVLSTLDIARIVGGIPRVR